MNDKKSPASGRASVFACEIPYARMQHGLTDFSERKKYEKIFARKLLEYAVGIFLPSHSGVEITKNGYGAPVTEGLFLSLSHTFSYAFAAVSDKPIGCDAEYACGKRNFEKLLSRIMTESEKSRYKSLIDEKELFYTLWTAKEAKFKRSGIPPFEPNKTETDGVKFFKKGDCFFAVDSFLPFDVRFLSFENENFVVKSVPKVSVKTV